VPTMYIATNLHGETVNSSGATQDLFSLPYDPAFVLINTINGGSLSQYGLITLPDGLFKIELSVLSANTTANVNVTSNNPASIQAYDAGFSVGAGVFGDSAVYTNTKDNQGQIFQFVGPTIWPTLFNGNRLYCTINLTWTGGVTSTWGCLKIEQLGGYASEGYLGIGNTRIVPGFSRKCMEEKKDCESSLSKGRGFVTPLVIVQDDDFESVSPQTAAISISSAKNDIILSQRHFLD